MFFRYGRAQVFKLSQKHFRVHIKKEKDKSDWVFVHLTGDLGYFLECDLLYPTEINDQTMSFPLCPENVEITFDMLSLFQKLWVDSAYDRK